jgi:hypothetical protein
MQGESGCRADLLKGPGQRSRQASRPNGAQAGREHAVQKAVSMLV